MSNNNWTWFVVTGFLACCNTCVQKELDETKIELDETNIKLSKLISIRQKEQQVPFALEKNKCVVGWKLSTPCKVVEVNKNQLTCYMYPKGEREDCIFIANGEFYPKLKGTLIYKGRSIDKISEQTFLRLVQINEKPVEVIPKPIEKKEPKPVKKIAPKPVKKIAPKPVKKIAPKPVKKIVPKPIDKCKKGWDEHYECQFTAIRENKAICKMYYQGSPISCLLVAGEVFSKNEDEWEIYKANKTYNGDISARYHYKFVSIEEAK